MKMKLFYTFLFLFVISLALMSCIGTGSGKPEGGTTEIIPVSKTYSASHEKVWQAARAVLDEWGYIYEANPSSNTIKTEPKQIGFAQQKSIFNPPPVTAKFHITVEDSTVSLRARFAKPITFDGGGADLEYPEKENELRKNFFETLNAKLGSSVMQIDKKQSSEIKDQPAQPASKVQLQGEAKETDPSPPTIATVRKAKKEQGLDGYIFQDRNSKKFFLEDSDGNTYKFTGGQWIKMK